MIALQRFLVFGMSIAALLTVAALVVTFSARDRYREGLTQQGDSLSVKADDPVYLSAGEVVSVHPDEQKIIVKMSTEEIIKTVYVDRETRIYRQYEQTPGDGGEQVYRVEVNIDEIPIGLKVTIQSRSFDEKTLSGVIDIIAEKEPWQVSSVAPEKGPVNLIEGIVEYYDSVSGILKVTVALAGQGTSTLQVRLDSVPVYAVTDFGRAKIQHAYILAEEEGLEAGQQVGISFVPDSSRKGLSLAALIIIQ
jgi:hypothetical protein